MADVAELGIKIDTNAEQAAAELKKFADAAGLSEKAAKDLAEGAKLAGTSMEETVKALGMTQAKTVLAARAYDDQTKAQKEATGSARQHAQELSGLEKALASFRNQLIGSLVTIRI